MAGQQHPFPTGFPSAQQNTMRNQFGGGQMVSGLMGPQQGTESLNRFFFFFHHSDLFSLLAKYLIRALKSLCSRHSNNTQIREKSHISPTTASFDEA